MHPHPNRIIKDAEKARDFLTSLGLEDRINFNGLEYDDGTDTGDSKDGESTDVIVNQEAD